MSALGHVNVGEPQPQTTAGELEPELIVRGHCSAPDVNSNPHYCYAVDCAPTLVCDPVDNLNGAALCKVACSSGLTSCDRACVELRTDPHHCGACGAACAAPRVCGDGTCW